MELPPHPETDQPAPQRPTAGVNWAVLVVVVVVGTLLALMVILHLTGAVGPGAH
jgi:hypothetical protein